MNAKNKRKPIGLIIGLICVVLCVVLLLTMCGKEPDDVQETSQPTQTQATEPTQESTEETTEATTEPTEESTEETTEPTEESTEPGKVVTTNNSIGSPGSTGTGSEDATEPTEEVVVDPGVEANPYMEVVAEYPSSVTTVKIPAKGTIYYNVYNTDGATLTVEDPDAYVILNGKTVEPVNGVVTVQLNTADWNTPAAFQIGNRSQGEEAYALKLTAPVGAPCNPEILSAIETVNATLATGDDNGHTYNWTAPEDGTVSFSVNTVSAGVTAEVVLRVGETSVSLSQNGVTDQTTGVTTVSADVAKGEVLTIQVLAVQGNANPAAQIELTGTFQQAYQLVENVNLTVGQNAVSMGDPALAYVFRFQPTAAGTYKFTTSDAAALLSYWGEDESFITDLTDTTDYDEQTNTFTITVDEKMVGKSCLIGVSGAAACTLTISKTA